MHCGASSEEPASMADGSGLEDACTVAVLDENEADEVSGSLAELEGS